jgi:hypothetical protein
MGIATIISLILTEAPQVIDLLNQLRADGKTEAAPEQLAALGLSDDALDAAIARAFPTNGE